MNVILHCSPNFTRFLSNPHILRNKDNRFHLLGLSSSSLKCSIWNIYRISHNTQMIHIKGMFKYSFNAIFRYLNLACKLCWLPELLCRLQRPEHPADWGERYPAYSHHDKIPPWWGSVSNDKGGNVSVSNSDHS